jgi:hypothetical protein
MDDERRRTQLVAHATAGTAALEEERVGTSHVTTQRGTRP